MFIVSMETTDYKIVIDQSLTLYAKCKHSPLAYALKSMNHGYILHTNLGTLGVVNNYYLDPTCNKYCDLIGQEELSY